MRGDTALLMAYGFDPYSGGGDPITLVAEIDLSDPDEMQVVRTLMVEADFVSARLIGERVALVVSARPSISSEFVYPSSESESAKSRRLRENVGFGCASARCGVMLRGFLGRRNCWGW